MWTLDVFGQTGLGPSDLRRVFPDREFSKRPEKTRNLRTSVSTQNVIATPTPSRGPTEVRDEE